MLTFRDYLTEQYLEEKLLTFGGKAYPKFGQIVIMAGGAGSGKGFVRKNLLGIEGYVYDVDELKLLATRSETLIQQVRDETGIDMSKMNTKVYKDALRDPKVVSDLHYVVSNILGLTGRRRSALKTSVFTAPEDRKPNIIFDITMKDLSDMVYLVSPFMRAGYKRENVHIVWVVNDIEVALKQNAERDRVVDPNLLLKTHRGASRTMRDIINDNSTLLRYMDGDLYLVFSKANVDNIVSKSDKGGEYLSKADYIKIKNRGEPIDQSKVDKNVKSKIASYVPKSVSWEWQR